MNMNSLQIKCFSQALQEEYNQLSKETRLSQDSGHSSSGYHSPLFLRPPSPPFFPTQAGSRTASDSNPSLVHEESAGPIQSQQVNIYKQTSIFKHILEQ